MRALVLGGGGFIGSHLVAALLKQGDQVRVLERPYRTPENADVAFHLISTTQPKSSNDDPSFAEMNL